MSETGLDAQHPIAQTPNPLLPISVVNGRAATQAPLTRRVDPGATRRVGIAGPRAPGLRGGV